MSDQQTTPLLAKVDEILDEVRKQARIDALKEALDVKVPLLSFTCLPTYGEHLIMKSGIEWKERAIRKLICEAEGTSDDLL